MSEMASVVVPIALENPHQPSPRARAQYTNSLGSVDLDASATQQIPDVNLRRRRTTEKLFEQSTIRLCRCDTFPFLNPISNQHATKSKSALQLPSFKSLGISSADPTYLPSGTGAVDLAVHHAQLVTGSKRTTPTAGVIATPENIGVTAPLTPPHDHASSGWPITMSDNVQDRSANASQSTGDSKPPVAQSEGDAVSTPTNLSVPRANSGNQPLRASWLKKVSQTIVSSLNSSISSPRIEMISQTLPSQARDSRMEPTFEEIIATIQLGVVPSPFITITHAVPQVRVMEELPKTPPTTPGASFIGDDYFMGHQTIFSRAAVVPIYHRHGPTMKNASDHTVSHIAAPFSVNVTILERYIPATKPEEVSDFFGMRATYSHLKDRLWELSAHNGMLLLVYPTRKGGEVFARKYIGPVIDPYLRQFVILNNLTARAADSLGHMTAVEAMMDFDELKTQTESLCSSLSRQSSLGNLHSDFQIVHAETAEVVPDRSTWLNWYIEQEQSRLRQNLVDYHATGGRMPLQRGNLEVTAGMLTRDLVEGIQKSTVPAGGVEIEVGVFLIQRRLLDRA